MGQTGNSVVVSEFENIGRGATALVVIDKALVWRGGIAVSNELSLHKPQKVRPWKK